MYFRKRSKVGELCILGGRESKLILTIPTGIERPILSFCRNLSRWFRNRPLMQAQPDEFAGVNRPTLQLSGSGRIVTLECQIVTGETTSVEGNAHRNSVQTLLVNERLKQRVPRRRIRLESSGIGTLIHVRGFASMGNWRNRLVFVCSISRNCFEKLRDSFAEFRQGRIANVVVTAHRQFHKLFRLAGGLIERSSMRKWNHLISVTMNNK